MQLSQTSRKHHSFQHLKFILYQVGCWFVGGDDLIGALHVLLLQLSSSSPSSLAPIKSRMAYLLVTAYLICRGKWPWNERCCKWYAHCTVLKTEPEHAGRFRYLIECRTAVPALLADTAIFFLMRTISS